MLYEDIESSLLEAVEEEHWNVEDYVIKKVLKTDKYVSKNHKHNKKRDSED